MAKEKKLPKPGFVDRILFRYYRKKLKANAGVSNDELEIVSEAEKAVIRKQTIRTSIVASFLGVMGMLTLYIPKYIWPDFFGIAITHKIPFIDGEQEFEWVFMLFSIILAQIETYLLVYYNAKAVANIANANGFPVVTAPDFEKHMNSLVVVALEKPDRNIKKFGIDPYYGLSKFGLFISMLIIRFKATLSNIFVKLIVSRILGRAVLRIYIDFVGLLVYPAWNVYASIQIINESKVRIMAPNLIRRLVDRLYLEFGTDSLFERKLYNTLNFISQVKRNYNFNLYLLTDAVIQTFNIEKPSTLQNTTEYIEHIKTLPHKERNGLLRLIIFGMLIDGKLTRRERRILQRLYDEKVSGIPETTTEQWSLDYLHGRGMAGFMAHGNFAGSI